MLIHKQVNIFIVDDNLLFSLAVRRYIETAFSDMQLTIEAFATGEKCMERFAALVPDLVILDYSLNSNSLGAANGLQVLKRIKKCNFKTSVIMLTSNEYIETVLESFHYGASDYVVKADRPFKKLNSSMSKVFAIKEMESQITEKEEKASIERDNRIAELIMVYNEKANAENSKLITEERNKDITDSITYAKRIQQAKLPRLENIYASLPQSFVLFQPKDIISGDFYFFQRSGQLVFIAAADCTGHGVPGALMSMLGLENLEDSVRQIGDTSEILKHLNRGIRSSLKQSSNEESTRDGLDIALCSLNTESRILKFSGANRPLWLIRKGKKMIKEFKGTKRAIGGFTDDQQHFDSHELKLQQGDTFYMSTDGYADQFGGQFGKKLMTKRLKRILIDIQEMSMPDQKVHLENYLEKWKSELEQVDDVLIIGVRM